MTPVISINGQLVVSSADGTLSVMVSPLDRGFMLGDGLFETIRVVQGTPWYLDRHLARLDRAARRFGLVLPDRLRSWIEEVLQHADKAGNGSTLRITVTRGQSETFGLAGTLVSDHPTVVTVLRDGPVFPQAAYERGVTAQIAQGARNERSVTSGYKTTSYAESIIALRDAIANGFDDAIFLDNAGFVSEATASNIFVVLGDVLVTPATIHGILPGITRAVILELARTLEISAAEREVRLEELLNADGAFLTSSLRGIMPLVRVNNNTLGNGSPGEMTHRFMRAYAQISSRV